MKKSITVRFEIYNLEDLMKNLKDIEYDGISVYMPIKNISMNNGEVIIFFAEE